MPRTYIYQIYFSIECVQEFFGQIDLVRCCNVCVLSLNLFRLSVTAVTLNLCY